MAGFRTGSCGAQVAMPSRSIASTRAASQASLSMKLTKPGPAMLVDATAADCGSAACIASPAARGFFGAPSWKRRSQHMSATRDQCDREG